MGSTISNDFVMTIVALFPCHSGFQDGGSLMDFSKVLLRLTLMFEEVCVSLLEKYRMQNYLSSAKEDMIVGYISSIRY